MIYRKLTKMEYKKTLNKTLGLRESSQGKDNLWESESQKLGFRLIGDNVVAAHCLLKNLTGLSHIGAGPQSLCRGWLGCWRNALGSAC